MKKKRILSAFTLLELMIALTLLAVIILAIFSFDMISREIFRSSERKSRVVNELAFVLDHIQKTIWMGEGNVITPAIELDDVGGNLVLRVRNTTAPYIGNYTFSEDQHQIIFEKAGRSYTISTRFYSQNVPNNFQIEEDDEGGGIVIKNLNLMYNPLAAYDPRRNPKVSSPYVYMYPYTQTGEGEIILESDTFEDGGDIPDRCTCDALAFPGISPHVKISSVPQEVKSLALIISEKTSGRVHWIVYDIDPADAEASEGFGFSATEGTNDPLIGVSGFDPFCPTNPGDQETYIFHVYALTLEPTLGGSLDRNGLVAVMQDKILKEAEIRGTYTRLGP
jgi:phosphatidylethanolamine-binding protein (PEBP) family uncharacterized protein